MKKRHWIVAGYIVAFACGAASGAAIVEGRSAARQAALLDKSSRRYDTYLVALDSRLGLTPTERQSIEVILERYEPRRRAVLTPVEPELHDLRSAMRREVREALDPAHRNPYDDLMREHDEARGRHADPPAPAPSTPGQ